MHSHYDVTITLHSGHQMHIPEWKGFNASAFSDIVSRADGTLQLDIDSPTFNLVRVDQIAAVTAEPSTGIRAVQHGDDGLYVWGCLRCGELGEDPSEHAGVVAFAGAMTHRCGGNRG